MDLSRRKRKRDRVIAVPSWFHSIDLGDGVVTPGHKSAEQLDQELAALRLPLLVGKSVLDIGAWDGFYSFVAEQRGARRVVAIDHYVWKINPERLGEYLRSCAANGEPVRPFDDVPELWHDGTPGRAGFDLVHETLGSEVEPVVSDFMTMDLASLGVFDVVLYLGVLYHMRNPLLALGRLRQVTRELAIIETEAFELPVLQEVPLCRFFEKDELSSDWSNWWVPNMSALVHMCRAAGFREVEIVSGPPEAARASIGSSPVHYRGIVHARP